MVKYLKPDLQDLENKLPPLTEDKQKEIIQSAINSIENNRFLIPTLLVKEVESISYEVENGLVMGTDRKEDFYSYVIIISADFSYEVKEDEIEEFLEDEREDCFKEPDTNWVTFPDKKFEILIETDKDGEFYDFCITAD